MMGPMRIVVACCAVSTALASSGCAPRAVAHLPLNVGNGVGSRYGNYASLPAGEMRGPSGERCFLFNWDRPLSSGDAIRITSASCEAREYPGLMIAREVSRTVIPMSESGLKEEADKASH